MNINGLWKGLSLILCGLLLVAALVGCSDQILLESGEIVTKGQKPSTVDPSGTQAPAQTQGEAETYPPLTLATQAETKPPISLDAIDPEAFFQGSETVMWFDFLQTGESDCILIRVGDKAVLVDTADIDDAQKIKNKLSEYGITTLDCLILTHYDNDHIGSVSALLASVSVGEVYMPDYVRDSGLYRSAVSAINERVEASRIHRLYGETVTFDLGGATFSLDATSLYERGMTVGADGATAGIVENNFSIITTVTLGDVSVLLTGDAENDRMTEFASRFEGGYPSYTMVKTPHHGEYSKSFAACLSQSRPGYCVVCTDLEEKVEPKLVTEMRACGASARYTYNGDISFATDGRTTRCLLTQK